MKSERRVLELQDRHKVFVSLNKIDASVILTFKLYEQYHELVFENNIKYEISILNGK